MRRTFRFLQRLDVNVGVRDFRPGLVSEALAAQLEAATE